MAKKNNTQNNNTGNQPGRKPAPVPQQKTTSARNSGQYNNAGFLKKYSNILIPTGIGILTYLFMRACTDNMLTNWDDLGYITTNPLIKDTSADAIKNIFALSFSPLYAVNPVMGNYHPITILLYYFEYSKYGLEPWIYHFDSVILHALCSIAVYFFVKKLSGRTVAATIAGLLFGLHPMHVESVAWAAGRKDILYGLFYVLAMTSYVYYLRTEGGKKTMWYIVVFALFVISLLSKGVAVILPIALLLIDLIEKRPLFITSANGSEETTGKKFNFGMVLDKIPFFGLAYFFGILAKVTQQKVGAYGSLDAHFTTIERVALSCYAFVTYLWKFIIPADLTNFYPYPLKVQDALPGSYYMYPVIVIALAAVVWTFARKNKVVLFGVGFFIANIILLLQFIPVGGAILSDRYSYIPYLGLFYILGWIVSEYFVTPEKTGTGKVLLGIVLVYSLVLGFASNERCKDWYDSISLWKDNVEKHPQGPVGYFYLGQEYFTRYEASTNPVKKKNMADSSMMYFNLSVERKPDYINPIICIAELQRNYGAVDDAKRTYYKALKISDKNESVYLGLAVIYAIKQQYDSASYCFATGLKLKPFSPEGHSNYANFYDIIGKLDSSLHEYAIAIEQNPDAYIPYMNRGRIYQRQNKLPEALKDFNKAVEKSTESGDVYLTRSKCYLAMGNKALALLDAQKAASLGLQVDPAYMSQLK